MFRLVRDYVYGKKNDKGGFTMKRDRTSTHLVYIIMVSMILGFAGIVNADYSGPTQVEDSEGKRKLTIGLSADEKAPSIDVLCNDGFKPEPVSDAAKNADLTELGFDAEAPADGKPVKYTFKCVPMTDDDKEEEKELEEDLDLN